MARSWDWAGSMGSAAAAAGVAGQVAHIDGGVRHIGFFQEKRAPMLFHPRLKPG